VIYCRKEIEDIELGIKEKVQEFKKSGGSRQHLSIKENFHQWGLHIPTDG
jgi:hypothetical protein